MSFPLSIKFFKLPPISNINKYELYIGITITNVTIIIMHLFASSLRSSLSFALQSLSHFYFKLKLSSILSPKCLGMSVRDVKNQAHYIPLLNVDCIILEQVHSNTNSNPANTQSYYCNPRDLVQGSIIVRRLYVPFNGFNVTCRG